MNSFYNVEKMLEFDDGSLHASHSLQGETIAPRSVESQHHANNASIVVVISLVYSV